MSVWKPRKADRNIGEVVDRQMAWGREGSGRGDSGEFQDRSLSIRADCIHREVQELASANQHQIRIGELILVKELPNSCEPRNQT